MRSYVRIPDDRDCGDGWERVWAYTPHRVAAGKGYRWVWWEWIETKAVGSAMETWAVYRLPKTARR